MMATRSTRGAIANDFAATDPRGISGSMIRTLLALLCLTPFVAPAHAADELSPAAKACFAKPDAGCLATTTVALLESLPAGQQRTLEVFVTLSSFKEVIYAPSAEPLFRRAAALLPDAERPAIQAWHAMVNASSFDAVKQAAAGVASLDDRVLELCNAAPELQVAGKAALAAQVGRECRGGLASLDETVRGQAEASLVRHLALAGDAAALTPLLENARARDGAEATAALLQMATDVAAAGQREVAKGLAGQLKAAFYALGADSRDRLRSSAVRFYALIEDKETVNRLNPGAGGEPWESFLFHKAVAEAAKLRRDAATVRKELEAMGTADPVSRAIYASDFVELHLAAGDREQARRDAEHALTAALERSGGRPTALAHRLPAVGAAFVALERAR